MSSYLMIFDLFQISNTANNLISTLFSTFPPTAFPSLIDMRGSQLLLSLVNILFINFCISLSLFQLRDSIYLNIWNKKSLNFCSLLFGISQAQAAKDSELKQQILNGPQKRMAQKRQTPPIHTNPLRSQQSPPSNSNTSPQNRIPLPANIPNTFQLLSLQQKANSLLGNQSFLASAPSISQTLATASNSSNRARPSSPLDLSASTPVGGKRLKIEATSPSRRTASPSPTTVQHPKTSCGSSENLAASDTSPTQIQRRCHAQTDEINSWTVEQVCNFVGSIDICAEYVEVRLWVFVVVFLPFFRISSHFYVTVMAKQFPTIKWSLSYLINGKWVFKDRFYMHFHTFTVISMILCRYALGLKIVIL